MFAINRINTPVYACNVSKTVRVAKPVGGGASSSSRLDFGKRSLQWKRVSVPRAVATNVAMRPAP